ncbi:glycoside hydrolase family 32 protein [Streptomyces sp. NPDC020403]|uniref:glycoside hydrolase family 32 protein n=1 Tax=unclassified Streptomyces TaxID=2593676 RepID=UPI0033D5A390
MSTHDHREPNPGPHFPALHPRPAKGWVNDPNGMVFHDGRYHVFFQYNPHDARHRDMHWGHLVSTDLLHWQELPLALAPTPGGVDADGVWSGNALSHDGRLTVFYAARRDDRPFQPVAAADSTDGVRFAKRPGLLVPEAPPGLRMFRDPYVWRDRWDGRPRMLVGAATEDGRGAAVHYTCTAPGDLSGWTYEGLFFTHEPVELADGRTTEEGWECVQYAPLGADGGALLVSCWDPEQGARATAAWPGRETEDGTFEATGPPQLLDYGPDFYAPAVLHAPDGRLLLWAWVWEARDEPRVGAPGQWIDEVGWAGMLSFPREVTLGDDGSVCQQPARELDELRTGERRVQARGTGSAELGSVPHAFDMRAELSGGSGLRIVTDGTGAEYLSLTRDPATGDVMVDRDRASHDPRAKNGRWRLPAPVGEPARIRVLVDHSVCEVFTDEGRSLTVRFYPVGGSGWRLMATGADAHAVDAWELPMSGGAR